jgi:hypothetical protein
MRSSTYQCSAPPLMLSDKCPFNTDFQSDKIELFIKCGYVSNKHTIQKFKNFIGDMHKSMAMIQGSLLYICRIVALAINLHSTDVLC